MLGGVPFSDRSCRPCVPALRGELESLLALDPDPRHSSIPIAMDQNTDDFGDLNVPENMFKYLCSFYMPDRDIPQPKPLPEDGSAWEVSDGSDWESVEGEEEEQLLDSYAMDIHYDRWLHQ